MRNCSKPSTGRINAQRKASGTTKGKAGESGGVGEERTAAGEPSNLDRIREQIQAISCQRDAEFADRTKATQEQIAKQLAILIGRQIAYTHQPAAAHPDQIVLFSSSNWGGIWG